MVRRYLFSKGIDETISDGSAPNSDTGPLLSLVGGLANRLRAITGKASWRDAPDATLADAATHHARQDNPHSVTRSQIGAAAATALSSHTADQSNPHAVTAAQAGARPATWIPGWNDVTGKPVSFPSSWAEIAGKPSSYPSSWTEVSGKPSTFAPSAHKSSHASGGSDALTAADVGAAPSSHVGSGGAAHAAANASTAGFLAAADKAKLNELVAVGPGLSGNGRAATPVGLRVYGYAAADRQGQTDFPVALNTLTKIPLENEIRDEYGRFSGGRYISDINGVLVVYGCVRWGGLVDTMLPQVYVAKNPDKQGAAAARTAGAELTAIDSAGSAQLTLGGSAPVIVVPGDTLELWVRINGSGGSPVAQANALTYLNIGYWGA